MKELLERFGPIEYMKFHETYSKIKQIGSLRDYQRKFEYLSTRIHEWLEKTLIGFFIGGLKSEITVEVKLKKTKTLMQVLEIAQIKEDQLQDLRRSSLFEVRKPLPMVSKFDNGKVVSKKVSSGDPNKSTPSGVKLPPLNVKRLS